MCNNAGCPIAYGYCHCGCGQKTRISTYSALTYGYVRGEPIRFLFNHQKIWVRREMTRPNPSGLCQCGCGGITPVASCTVRSNGHLKGEHLRYIKGHHYAGHGVTFVDHFWSKVLKDGPIPSHCPEIGQCWEWQAFIHPIAGYGTIRCGARIEQSHRVAWSLINGPIPPGIQVLHKCDNRRCCNPTHLFLGTTQDNSDDKLAKGRQAHGPYRRSKPLTDDEVRAIRHARAQGETIEQLAKRYGRYRQTIVECARGITYQHVAS